MIEQAGDMIGALIQPTYPYDPLEPGRVPVVHAAGLRAAPTWLPAHRGQLRDIAQRHGAVLVRGLQLADTAMAAQASRCLLGPLMSEREPFAPRTAHGDAVYSGTIWPPDQQMCMHHELSYGNEFPGLLAFSCLQAPRTGGATALADGAAVLRDLPAALVERFEAVGWELLRTHNEIVGVPWQEAFGTGDPLEVEQYCLANDIRWRWDGKGGLHTRRRRPAILRHSATGERVWFNQIAFLNEWTMEPAVREYLAFEFGVDGLPFTTRFGDGEPLDQRTVDLINDVYTAHAVREPWQDGDLMLVDNIRMAHSRDPYTGTREIVVAMGERTTRTY